MREVCFRSGRVHFLVLLRMSFDRSFDKEFKSAISKLKWRKDGVGRWLATGRCQHEAISADMQVILDRFVNSPYRWRAYYIMRCCTPWGGGGHRKFYNAVPAPNVIVNSVYSTLPRVLLYFLEAANKLFCVPSLVFFNKINVASFIKYRYFSIIHELIKFSRKMLCNLNFNYMSLNSILFYCII